MSFKILTAIVFIAEIIIAYTFIKKLVEVDKIILKTSENISEIKPKLKDIGYLIKKISAQLIDFSYDFVYKIQKKRDESISGYINKILISIILLKINYKFLRKIVRSKHFRRLSKCLSMLKYVV